MSALLHVSRLCRAPIARSITLKQFPRQPVFRTFADEGRDVTSRVARRATLRERAMAPTTGLPFTIGQGALAGGSLLGLGALAFYGLGLSSETGTLERSHVWPKYVKDRIKTTYMYLSGGLAVTAASAMLAFQSPTVMNLVMKNGFMGIVITLGAIMGTGMIAQSIPYEEGFGVKQMAWLLHTGVMGAVLAPMCFMGGPLLIRAAWYTAGVVGGLSTIAICAPSEKFLNMGAPLAMGLGVVFASSMGTMFLPPTTALGAGLYSISLYGGLLLFSAFLLYDTQRIIAQAERYPPSPQLYGVRPYDPINASISIYLDVLNIFIRIATILAGGGGQRKK